MDTTCDEANLKIAATTGFFDMLPLTAGGPLERVEYKQCEFSRRFCEPGGNFNFFELYYCALSNVGNEKNMNTIRNVIFIPLAFFFLFIFFYLLSDTADEFLSPALERITEMTGMSESLAGVTLLAFGNGAPDIFASISSASSSTRPTTPETSVIGDNSAAASALIGSAFFVTAVVQALVLRAGKPDQRVKVTPTFFVRDLVSVFIALLYLLVHILFVGFINLFSAIGFLVLYSIFVVVVVITNKREASKNGEKEEYKDAIDFIKNASVRGEGKGALPGLQRQEVMTAKKFGKINKTLWESSDQSAFEQSRDQSQTDGGDESHLKALVEEDAEHQGSIVAKDKGSVFVKHRKGTEVSESHHQDILDQRRFLSQKIQLQADIGASSAAPSSQLYIANRLQTIFRQ